MLVAAAAADGAPSSDAESSDRNGVDCTVNWRPDELLPSRARSPTTRPSWSRVKRDGADGSKFAAFAKAEFVEPVKLIVVKTRRFSAFSTSLACEIATCC